MLFTKLLPALRFFELSFAWHSPYSCQRPDAVYCRDCFDPMRVLLLVFIACLTAVTKQLTEAIYQGGFYYGSQFEGCGGLGEKDPQRLMFDHLVPE